MNSCMSKRISPRRIFRSRGALLLALMGPLLVMGFGTSGCVYRLAIQQGNFLDPAQVEQLQAGMTRAQVRFLLGTPMLPDAFDRDRWDYIYYLKMGRIKDTTQRRLTVWFENDKVSRFENQGIPAAPKAAAVDAPAAAPAAAPAKPVDDVAAAAKPST